MATTRGTGAARDGRGRYRIGKYAVVSDVARRRDAGLAGGAGWHVFSVEPSCDVLYVNTYPTKRDAVDYCRAAGATPTRDTAAKGAR